MFGSYPAQTNENARSGISEMGTIFKNNATLHTVTQIPYPGNQRVVIPLHCLEEVGLLDEAQVVGGARKGGLLLMRATHPAAHDDVEALGESLLQIDHVLRVVGGRVARDLGWRIGELTGFDVEVVSAVAEELGVDVRTVFRYLERARELEEGPAV